MTSVTNTVDISSSINLQTTSGVLSQMTIYTWPMETSFQQTIFQVIILYRIVNPLVAISPEPYLIPRCVVLTTRGHDTRFLLPYSMIVTNNIFFHQLGAVFESFQDGGSYDSSW
jgi:hypothetical protein